MRRWLAVVGGMVNLALAAQNLTYKTGSVGFAVAHIMASAVLFALAAQAKRKGPRR